MAYDPAVAPLELPVQVLHARLAAPLPLQFPPKAASTAGTTLAGAFGEALWRCGCRAAHSGGRPCDPAAGGCRQADSCPLPWLYKPYFATQRRTPGRPVRLWSRELESGAALAEFTLRVLLLGRMAVALRETVAATLGGLVVKQAGRAWPLRLLELREEAVLTIAERARRLAALPWARARLRLETPLLHTIPVQVGEQTQSLYMAGGELPLARLVGNAAYELAAWDLEERNLPHTPDRASREALAAACRDHAAQTVGPVAIDACNLQERLGGFRASRANPRHYPLVGVVGEAELAGPLAAALPWLLAMTLFGAGQRREMGFGVTTLWLESS